MDVLDFSEEIKNFRHNGVTLNLDERMQLEMSLNALQCKSECEELQFWGKISGLKNDYYVALGLKFTGMYEFPVKTFFWALSSDFQFKEMPRLTGAHDALIDQDNTWFEGTPEKVLSKEEGKEDDGGDGGDGGDGAGDDGSQKPKEGKDSDETSEEEITVPTKPLTELDRLTTVVHAIENDCQICPVGSFKMTPEHQVRRNEAFRGLTCEDAGRLDSYMHFRNVQCPDLHAQLDLPTASFNNRFLESIGGDAPKGCWTLQMCERKQSVLVRSLQWQGYQFYHKLGAQQFGAIYIGDGLKNLDLHFMV